MLTPKFIRIPLGALLAATARSLALAPGAYASKADHVSCGQTITADTTLDSDLTKCKGPGITIGADGITLDLNGHTIEGAGKGSGVLNLAGHDGVTIGGGSIRGFAGSIAVVGATDNRMQCMNVFCR